MKPDLSLIPLKLEGIVETVEEPRPLKDKRSSFYGKIHTEFHMVKKWGWNGARRKEIGNHSFWGELPKELEGLNIRIYSNGNAGWVHDTITDKWYESNISQEKA